LREKARKEGTKKLVARERESKKEIKIKWGTNRDIERAKMKKNLRKNRKNWKREI
jgi:hypothetical protein